MGNLDKQGCAGSSLFADVSLSHRNNGELKFAIGRAVRSGGRTRPVDQEGSSRMLTRWNQRIGRIVTKLAALSAICGVTPSAVVQAAQPAGVVDLPAPSDKAWTIEIRPADYSAAATGSQRATASAVDPVATAAAASGALVPQMTYQEAYRAVPFNREEYEANPGYRHDAAIELMYGSLRPTTVIKQNIPYFSRYPDFFRNRFQIYPYPGGSNQHSLNMYWLWSTNAITW